MELLTGTDDPIVQDGVWDGICRLRVHLCSVFVQGLVFPCLDVLTLVELRGTVVRS